MLTVEVKGISFANKGAELMLHAIIAQFEERGVAARFVVEPHGPYQRRASYGLWQKTRYIRKRINWLAPMKVLPQRLRTMFGMVNESEIDVVLDASGFSYGDQWSPAVARDRLASSIGKLRSQGKPVVVLPQALGPFEKAASKAVFKPILTQASLVFARDQHSYQYCLDLLGCSAENKPDNLAKCPDFTNLIKGIACDSWDAELHQTCFIPNAQMLAKRQDDGQYVAFMVAALRAAQEADAKPFLLIHEADADRQLARDINAQLTTPVPVLDPGHALKIKWVIGQSRVVVSSRFHGLVSALSQGIPVLATGWSHKYQELLGDYQCAEQLFDVNQDADNAVENLRQLLIDGEAYTTLQATVQAAGDWQREAAKQMWDAVFALFEKR